MINYSNKLDISKLKTSKYISSGACGSVYKSNYDNKDVIVKKLHIENYYDKESWLNDANLELNIYQYLKNTKYCCELFGYCYNKKEIYLILKDYKVIGDLHDFLNQNIYWSKKKYYRDSINYIYNNVWCYNMERKLKVNLTKKLLDSIEELHERNVVHCDIKTNNLLFDEINNKIIIIDFNASHYMKNNIDTIDKHMGTEGYACPALNYEGICSMKSDIYSIGVCILEIWCGGIWNKGVSFSECRKEVLKTLRNLNQKEYLLAKQIRYCINLHPKKRPYIKTLKKNINKII